MYAITKQKGAANPQMQEQPLRFYPIIENKGNK